MNAKDWIKELDLQAHPEGGYFKETYRCQENLTAVNLPERFDQTHSFFTAIFTYSKHLTSKYFIAQKIEF